MALATTSTLAVIERDKRFLLVQEIKPHVEGLYGLPGGGIDSGETPEEAVVREVLEETGMQAFVEQLIGVYYRYKKPLAAGQNVGFVYACSVADGEPKTSKEHPAVVWRTVTEIRQLATSGQLRTPHLVTWIERYLQQQHHDRAVVTTLFD